jgi:hypothetical protein
VRRHHLILLSLFLIVLGLGTATYKLFILGFPLTPDTSSPIWNVEAQVRFTARNKSAQVGVTIPRSNDSYAVMDENFVSRGFGLTTNSIDMGNREAVWSIRKALGQHTLYYKAIVRQLDAGESLPVSKIPEVPAHGLEGASLAAAETILADIRSQSADLVSLLAELSKRLNQSPPNENVIALIGKKPSDVRRIEAATQILALGAIPARAVHGIQLERDNRNAPILHWIEVFQDKKWTPYHLLPQFRPVENDYLAWWRGNISMAHVKDGDRLAVNLSVSQYEESAVETAIVEGQLSNPLLLQFSLFSLPMETQSVYKMLLLVPIGAFIVMLFRTLIGLNTFGTFMPVLIALAFRETELLWGVILFTVLVTLGLFVRFYLEQLKLLLVPRLAAVLTVVVLLMTATSIITHQLDLERGLSVALFPMIILTMTIERMSIVWEEAGAANAIKRGIGSLLTAAVVYLVFSNQFAQHTIFVFPELLLVVLAGNLLMGRYRGYRLSELRRFRALVDPATNVTNSTGKST